MADVSVYTGVLLQHIASLNYVSVRKERLINFTSVSARYNGYIDGWSQIKVHTVERTQVHSAQSFLVVTHPSTIALVDTASLKNVIACVRAVPQLTQEEHVGCTYCGWIDRGERGDTTPHCPLNGTLMLAGR